MPISYVQPGLVLLGSGAAHAAQLKLPNRRFQALLQPLAAHLLEVAVDGVAVGNGELGKGIVDRVQLEVAALGDFHGPRQDPGRVGKQARHFVGGLDKELIGVELEAVRVLNLGVGLHAQHHVVRVRVFAAEIMRVVGCDQRECRARAPAGRDRSGSCARLPGPGPGSRDKNCPCRKCPGTASATARAFS